MRYIFSLLLGFLLLISTAQADEWVFQNNNRLIPAKPEITDIALPCGQSTLCAPVVVLCSFGASLTTPANTNENILATCVIPAGAMGANGSLIIHSAWLTTASANNKTLRIRLGGIAGSAFLSSTVSTAATHVRQTVITNRNDAASQISGFPNGNIDSSSVALVTGTANTATQTTLVLTGQKASAGEDLILERYFVELVPGR